MVMLPLITLWLVLLGKALAQSPCQAPVSTTRIPWIVSETRAPLPDGSLGKYLTVNQQWPAPAVTVSKCTRISLEVDNQSHEDVSLRKSFMWCVAGHVP